MAMIPDDLLISEVLSRLPVRSVLRFRSMCCSWRDAVADPAFVRRHLELSRARPTRPLPPVLAVHTRTVVDPSNRAAIEDVVSFHRVRPGQSSSAAAVDLMLEEAISNTKALQCAGTSLRTLHCDGLVAVAAKVGQIFVCNPATKEFFALPPGTPGPYDYRRPEEVAALGFDPCTGSYVVARCFYRHYDRHNDEYTGEQFLEYDMVHEVFTLGASGSGDWETTEAPPCPINTVVPPACARGAFYWATNDLSNAAEKALPNALLRFALHDGTFAVVQLPPSVDSMDVAHDTLTELGGELCYTRAATRRAFDVWMLPAAEQEGWWSLRWRVDFYRPVVGVVLPLAVATDGTLTVSEDKVKIHRYDGRNSILEKTVDVAAVYRDLIDQWDDADAEEPEENPYGYCWEPRDGSWQRVPVVPPLPTLQSLFTYVESLVQIN